ncbi:phosphoinositide-interacting protein [Lepisosteus oculatus]|uniref:phosphoinositide-interacting protein n=1 Tax=Lepisosteus oculatus TaxID=7918 RepID=UPI00073FA9FA|nr:PREDICTED: phosphoinositide-interacting protein [Lepisosteus oculatus]
MLSTGIMASGGDCRPAAEDTASPVRRALRPDPGPAGEEPARWTYFHKPIIIMAAGGLLFGAGTVLAFLYFTRAAKVPYALGPVCLSIGLMFLVTGLVWVPVIKQKLRYKGVIRKTCARSSPC